MADRQRSREQALEDAVSRALRDNLAPLQRTADDLHQAYADFVAACSSSRPSNALPAMLRAQTAASSLAAGLSVLSNFVAVSLSPGDRHMELLASGQGTAVAEEVETEGASEPQTESAEETAAQWDESEVVSTPTAVELDQTFSAPVSVVESAAEIFEASPETGSHEPAFDISNLSAELQDLHRRANRAAKVTMQDIKLLHPADVRAAREQKDICGRMRGDIDKARKEYDRRFRAIQDHPVDYFHRWMVEILAEGDVEALGEYPYPSPVLRQ